jgi:hypothetical protein
VIDWRRAIAAARSRARVELVHRASEIARYGVGRDEQLVGYLVVRLSVGQQAQDLAFTPSRGSGGVLSERRLGASRQIWAAAVSELRWVSSAVEGRGSRDQAHELVEEEG